MTAECDSRLDVALTDLARRPRATYGTIGLRSSALAPHHELGRVVLLLADAEELGTLVQPSRPAGPFAVYAPGSSR
jgi:hypothetical protein